MTVLIRGLGTDLIVANGFLFADSIGEMAARFPDTKIEPATKHGLFHVRAYDRRRTGSLRAAHVNTSTRNCQLAMTSGFMRML